MKSITLDWLGRSVAGILALLFLAMAWPARAQDQPQREFRECPQCPVMVGIPAGRFIMGSPASERGRFDNEGPQHYVSVRAFALGKYDVTSDEFRSFLAETGYRPAPCNKLLNLGWRSPGDGRAYPPDDVEPPKWPAVCLDWRDADAYIIWLNVKVKAARPALAGRSGPYRLPSEAEWEYAARAGTTTARWWGNAIGVGNANCNGCGSRWDNHLLSEVDQFRPNPFGLYGMLGNAWQWTADCWHKNYVGAPTNGTAWTEPGCTKYVLRGGSWDNVPVFVRSAARSGSPADGGEYDYSSLAGFRVARDLP
ncbi:MAG TPA: formylglycine-generating enzyme family protein [Rhizomicrobium sp.]|nr:formylglycine-generating enzyme family protein [Rhizomicrobium sp.]